MSKLTIWAMKAALELGAFLVVLFGIISGDVFAALLGFDGDGGLFSVLIGLFVGISAATVFFGMPLLLINISESAGKTATLLEKIEKHLRPAGFANSPSPYFPDEGKVAPSAESV